jgi:hypothetical protein
LPRPSIRWNYKHQIHPVDHVEDGKAVWECRRIAQNAQSNYKIVLFVSMEATFIILNASFVRDSLEAVTTLTEKYRNKIQKLLGTVKFKPVRWWWWQPLTLIFADFVVDFWF